MCYQRYGLICRSRAGWMAQQTLVETRSAARLSLTIDNTRSGIISASDLKPEPTDLWHSLVRHDIGMCDRWIHILNTQMRRRKQKGSDPQEGWGKDWFTLAKLSMTSLVHKEIKQLESGQKKETNLIRVSVTASIALKGRPPANTHDYRN